jgi:hypothetical protein
MTDRPARLRDDGRVVLEPEGSAPVACALKAALRSAQRNGRAPDDPLRWLASMLALAAPSTAAHLPPLLATAGPEVTTAVRLMTGGGIPQAAGCWRPRYLKIRRPDCMKMPRQGSVSIPLSAAA